MSSASKAARAPGRVDDIIVAIDEIYAFTDGVSASQFLSDRKLHLAVTYLLQIVGEASKHLMADVEERHALGPIPFS